MGSKKKRNKHKKESPWKDIPVTPYEKIHPKELRSPEQKEERKKLRKKIMDDIALQRLRNQRVPGVSATRKQLKIPKNIQRVPIQVTVPVGVDKETGEQVVAKVKTNKFRTIVHSRKTG